MRVVVTGASGNIGTSVLAALARDPEVDSIVGIARRRPQGEFPKTTWHEADVASDELGKAVAGADAVIHLAWRIQPSRDLSGLWMTNVVGSERVAREAVAARVPALVYSSSLGVYSPGPKDRAVDESWPRDGVATSFYGRHKAEVERRLDAIERDRPDMRIVRIRPGLVFKREAAQGIRRIFAGPFLPGSLVRRGRIPLIPQLRGLRFQAVHSLDVGEAFRLAVKRDVRGAFNIAAEPVLDPPVLARVLGGRLVPTPSFLVRGVIDATYALRLQPTPPGWFDLGMQCPVMDTRRAREELGWTPTKGADEALAELIDGLHEGAGLPTPPLDPSSGGPLRLREIAGTITGTERS